MLQLSILVLVNPRAIIHYEFNHLVFLAINNVVYHFAVQDVLIVWGEEDQIFNISLAYKLKE